MNEIIINREELYSYLTSLCGIDYVFGIHGIDEFKIDTTVENVKKSILDKGLLIKHGRTLLGTVSFTNSEIEDEETFVNYHTYGSTDNYILVALPKTLRTASGESLYVGYPTYDNLYSRKIATQGYQLTSLSDALIPCYEEDCGVLDPMFILGDFSYVDEDNIKLTLNSRHISFHDGVVPDEYFNEKNDMLLNSLNLYGIKDGDSYKINFKYCEEILKIIDSLYDMDERALKMMLSDKEMAPIIRNIINSILSVENNLKPSNVVPGNFPVLYNEMIRQYILETYNIDIKNVPIDRINEPFGSR